MRVLFVVSLLVAVLPLFVVCATYTCADLQCHAPLSECCDQSFGAQCYNPSIHKCSEFGSSLYLCPVDHPSACGRACYNANQYHCVDGQLVQGPDPNAPRDEHLPEPTMCADLDCYYPLSQCCEQSFGAQCYDPTVHTCAVFNTSYYLCPLYYPKACADACYHPSEYHCVSGQLVQGAEVDYPPPSLCDDSDCAAQDLRCCEIEVPNDGSMIAQCYDRNIYACKGKILCLVGLESCGLACYHPDYFSCENGQLQSRGAA